jgi:uncharacterized repeat protein (TIGR02543 family)
MNKKQIHTAAAVFLMLGFSACNMIGPEPRQVPAGPDGKAAVSVNIEAADIQSRTVLPSAALDEVTAWELWGRMWGDPEKKIADFSGANATVYLEEGTWDFTLEGYTGDDLILRGSIQNQYIYLEGPNILNFTVEPVLEGNGTFKITINLPEGHGITTAKVFKEGVQIDTITPLEDAIVFENTYPAGDYYFSFRLYNNNDLYGVVSEMARVRGNLQSEKTYTLDRENLNLTYMVTYHLNDGQLGGGEANPDYYRSTDAAFNLPVPTRAGYAFLGWYTEAEFVNKVTEIAQGSTGDKIFHAKWTLVTYDITYTLNNETNAVQNPANYTIETPDITLADPSRTGYTFEGWYTEAEFENPVTEIAQGSTGDKIFHAKWTPVTYAITYTLNNGTNAVQNPADYTIETPDITLADPSLAGYAFMGWYTEAEFENPVTEIAQGSTGDRVFYAKWTPAYTITYTLNGGINAVQNPAYYVSETTPITLADPSRAGYTFEGWYTEAEFVNKVTEIAQGSTGDKIFHAKWTLVTYAITYTLNDGTNAVQNPVDYTIETPDITLADPLRTGYTFLGWYTEAGFVNAVTQIAQGSTGNKTFHAKWMPSVYTITYTLNNGTNAVQNPADYTIETPDITLADPSRTGYTFLGWYTEAGFVNKVTQIAQGSMEDKTFHAKWIGNGRDITGFRIAAAQGTISGTNITIILPYDDGAEINSLAPVISVSPSATVSPASGVTQNFNSPVMYTVTAEDGSQQMYTVTVKNSRARITAFSFVSPSATGIIIEPAKTISVPVPYGTSVAALVPAISISPGAAIDPAPGQVQNFNSPVTYTVTAENGSIAAYTVTARIPGQGVVSLVLPMDTASGALTDTPIVLSGSGVSEQTLTVSGDFDSYRWRVNGTLTGNGKSITLKATDYTAAVYQITVEVTKDGAVYSKIGSFTVQN